MNGETTHLGDEGDDRDAYLEVLQTRQLLGLPIDSAEPAEQMLARTLNRIEAGEPDPANARRPHSRGRGVAPWSVAAGIVVLAVAGATFWPSPALAAPPGLWYPRDITELAHAPAATATFARLAELSAGRSDSDNGSVQYIATTAWVTVTDGTNGSGAVVPKDRQWWVEVDGSALAVERTGAPLDDNGALASSGALDGPAVSSDQFAPGSVPTSPGGLPSDPLQLRDQLGEACAGAANDGACLLTRVGELASTHLLTAEFTGALWGALEPVASIRELGPTTDRTGRSVVALAAGPHQSAAGSSIVVLLVDSLTGEPVGYEEITLSSETLPVEAPTVTAFMAVTNARWVDEVGEIPDS